MNVHILKRQNQDIIILFFRSDYPYLDVGDNMGNTPLHVVASAGHFDVVKYLVEERKVSPFIKNEYVLIHKL